MAERGTGDEDVAFDRCKAKLAELKGLLEDREPWEEKQKLDKPRKRRRLGEYVDETIAGLSVKESTRTYYREKGQAIVAGLGPARWIDEITVSDLRRYVDYRLRQVKVNTVSGELATLSVVFGVALVEELALSNVVSTFRRSPLWNASRLKQSRGEIVERPWLEEYEVARLLRAAQVFKEGREEGRLGGVRTPILEILATWAFTGCRPKEEGLTIRRKQLEFDRDRVKLFSTKTGGNIRYVPLWPQYREIIEPHCEGMAPEKLLFESSRKPGVPLTDVRGSLETIIDMVDLPNPERVTPYIFRHTYTAMRLQTLQDGAPVSLMTVVAELGHKGLSMLEQRYAHELQDQRNRRPFVAYHEHENVIPLSARRTL